MRTTKTQPAEIVRCFLPRCPSCESRYYRLQRSLLDVPSKERRRNRETGTRRAVCESCGLRYLIEFQ
jgi:hypothetical protein